MTLYTNSIFFGPTAIVAQLNSLQTFYSLKAKLCDHVCSHHDQNAGLAEIGMGTLFSLLFKKFQMLSKYSYPHLILMEPPLHHLRNELKTPNVTRHPKSPSKQVVITQFMFAVFSICHCQQLVCSLISGHQQRHAKNIHSLFNWNVITLL